MRLNQALTQLPIRFSGERLAAEVNALPATAWTPHPSGYPGNDAVRLVTPDGNDTDSLFGPMAPTEHLQRCPYIMDVMAELGAVWGRSRLMGLGAGAEVPGHIDVNYYWRTHTRVHIPVITNPGVKFTCGGETVKMAAGECWVLDTFRSHTVVNQGSARRVHLVIDTVGGEHLWDLIRAGEAGANADGPVVEPKAVSRDALVFERTNAPTTMSPWEIKCHIADLLADTQPHPDLRKVAACLDRFTTAWAAAWARFETSEAGLPVYSHLVETVRHNLAEIGTGDLTLANGRLLYFVLDVVVFIGATGREKDAGTRPLAFGPQISRQPPSSIALD
ncbi:MAG: aspartyl/asparaginyl beta-hydroxylase domain-containing protein [Sphingomonas sp.]